MSLQKFLSFYLIGDPKGEKCIVIKKSLVRKIRDLEYRLYTLIPNEDTVVSNVDLKEIDNTKKEIHELKILLKQMIIYNK